MTRVCRTTPHPLEAASSSSQSSLTFCLTVGYQKQILGQPGSECFFGCLCKQAKIADDKMPMLGNQLTTLAGSLRGYRWSWLAAACLAPMAHNNQADTHILIHSHTHGRPRWGKRREKGCVGLVLGIERMEASDFCQRTGQSRPQTGQLSCSSGVCLSPQCQVATRQASPVTVISKNKTSGGVHGQMASRKRSSNSHSRPDTFWWCMARVGLGDPVEGLECKALAHSSDNMIPWARKGFLSANQPERLRE